MSDALHGALERLNGVHGGQRIVVRHRTGDTCLTFRELYALSSRIGNALRQNQLGAASRIAVLMHTNLDTIATIVAVLRLGATLIPVFPYPRPQQRESSGLALKATLRAGRASALVLPQSQLNDYARALASEATPPALLPVERLQESRANNEISNPEPANAPALIQFSSGSTSFPKGIVIERDALMAGVAGPADRLSQTPSDIFCSWLPLYHDYGLVGSLFQAILNGASIWLMPPQDFIRAPLEWVRLLSDSKSTITGAPNFSYQFVVSKLDATVLDSSVDLSSLKLATNAAEPVSALTIRSFQSKLARYGLRASVIQPTYGLAENCAAATMPAPLRPLKILPRAALPMSMGDAIDKPTNSFVGLGSELLGSRIRIISNGGEALPGTTGSIFVSGLAAARRFVDAKGEFYSCLTDHGVDSGDLGLLWEEDLYVVRRKKEMFKYGGRNFSPADLETSLLSALSLQPNSVCVYSTNPGLQGLDQINVMIELSPSKSKERFHELTDQIQGHIRREFEIPVSECIAVKKGQLPRTTSGKLRRVHLRQLHESGALESELDILERSPPPLNEKRKPSLVRLASRQLAEITSHDDGRSALAAHASTDKSKTRMPPFGPGSECHV